MHLAIGYAFNLSDLFQNLNLKRLKISCADCEKLIHDRHRNKLAEKIFRENMKMVFEDIIENNITFELPSGSKKSDIHMKKIEGEEFKRCRKSGKFKDINFLKTYFTAYQPCFYMYSNNRTRVKPIYLDKRLLKRLNEKINSGMQYC